MEIIRDEKNVKGKGGILELEIYVTQCQNGVFSFTVSGTEAKIDDTISKIEKAANILNLKQDSKIKVKTGNSGGFVSCVTYLCEINGLMEEMIKILEKE